MPRYKTPPRKNQRQAVLAALSGTPKARAARDAGINRKTLYKLLEETTDPDEMEFRRKVQELVEEER